LTFSAYLKVKFHQSLSNDLRKPFRDEMDRWANMDMAIDRPLFIFLVATKISKVQYILILFNYGCFGLQYNRDRG